MSGVILTPGGAQFSFVSAGLFIDVDPETVDRERFVLSNAERVEPVYEFMYLAGGVVNGQLNGLWTPPPVSATNAALLFPEPLAFFMQCIEQANSEGRAS